MGSSTQESEGKKGGLTAGKVAAGALGVAAVGAALYAGSKSLQGRDNKSHTPGGRSRSKSSSSSGSESD